MPLRRCGSIPVAAILLVLILMLASCARTDISSQKTDADRGPLPRPDQIIVYNFAVSPDEVKLERGLVDRVRNLVSTTPRTQREKELGWQVADATAVKLVEELIKNGLPAERALDNPPLRKRPIIVRGQFVSIDAGNRTGRLIIGFGRGHSEVEAHVQLYETLKGRSRIVEEIDATTRSGRKPGMAAMMGIGGLAGRLATSAAISASAGAASEALSANVKAIAEDMAKKIAAKIVQFYRDEEWL
ncbi:MAG: DUF4410 domain-containing protein [Alphaproteobacteria bacterium]|nr:DUF4410 domain-containing protein [Alphaproteobacteria bacterium]